MKYLWPLVVLFLSNLLTAQESENPLFSSFEEYKKTKENTPFQVKWILAGPVTNSARVEAYREIRINRGPCMLLLDQAIYGRQQIMDWIGNPFLKTSQPWVLVILQ